jgi:hypothetical protein
MSRADEERLTDWMASNARVSWVIDPEPWNRERELLSSELWLPLNIQGVTGQFAAHLRELRALAGRSRDEQRK